MKRSRTGKAAILEPWQTQAIHENFSTKEDKLIWQILRYTGERISAVLKLRVENVYYHPETASPYPEITFPAKIRKKSPDGKSSSRQVPVAPKLMSALRDYSPRKQGFYLFPAPSNHSKHLSRETYDSRFRVAVKKAGLENAGISLHSPRRTLVTRLHEQGHSVAMIQSITGHKSLAALQKYIDVGPEATRQAISNIDL